MQLSYVETPPDWEEHERPKMPGSPARLHHSMLRRCAYVLVGIFVGLVGGLGNGLVTANLTAIQGQLGLTQVEAAWLPAAYVMVNVTANLLVFKSRQQLGMRVFAEWGLGIYAVLALAHVFVEGFTMSLVVRGVSGFAAATTTSLAVMYVMQGFPVTRIPSALIVAMNMSPLALPLAWVLSPTLVSINPWPHLYAFEAGLALIAFASVVVLKLPRGMQIHVFESLDLLTFALVAPAVALLCAVLAQGVNGWWLNTPWLAYALIASIVLFTLAGILEYSRSRPLIQLRWLANRWTLMFMLGALLMRLLISEQNYGAVGLLRAMGMNPEQLQPLYGVILCGMVLGIVVGACTFTEKTIFPQILLSVALICIGGYLDLHSTSHALNAFPWALLTSWMNRGEPKHSSARPKARELACVASLDFGAAFSQRSRISLRVWLLLGAGAAEGVPRTPIGASGGTVGVWVMGRWLSVLKSSPASILEASCHACRYDLR